MKDRSVLRSAGSPAVPNHLAEPVRACSQQWRVQTVPSFALHPPPAQVLTVQSGDDMPSLAREIAHHFDTQGAQIVDTLCCTCVMMCDS